MIKKHYPADQYFLENLNLELRRSAIFFAKIVLAICTLTLVLWGSIVYAYEVKDSFVLVAMVMGLVAFNGLATLLIIRNKIHSAAIFHASLLTLTIYFLEMSKLISMEWLHYFILSYFLVYLLIHLLAIVTLLHSAIEFIISFTILAVLFINNRSEFISPLFISEALFFILIILISFFLSIVRYNLAKREAIAQIIIDLSNKRLNEQELEIESQNQKIIQKEVNLRSILDNTNSAIGLIDSNYNLIEANQRFFKDAIAIFKKNVKLGNHILNLLQEDEQGLLNWKKRLDVAFEGKSYSYTDFYTDFGYVQVNIFPIEQAGHINRAVLFAKNITKRKLAEQMLTTSNERFKAVIESTQDAVYTLDEYYNYLIFNTHYYNMVYKYYGVTIEQGQNILKVLSTKPDESLRLKKHLDAALNGQSFIVEQVFENLDGLTDYLEVSYNPIKNQEGQINGVAVFVKDVTSRNKAEEVIRHNEQMLNSINHNIQEGIYRTSYDGHFIYANEAMAKLFGYKTATELLQLNASDLYADLQDRSSLLKKILEKNNVSGEEVLFRRKDGSTFWGLLSSLVHKGSNDNEIIFDGAIRDITQSKEFQQRLEEQNEELKKINSELDRFVYSASHDLKAPLASVLGLIGIAKDEKDHGTVVNYLEMMSKSVKKLDNFIKDIIHYSRNSRMEVMSEEIDFVTMVNEVLEDLRYLEQSHQITKNITSDIEHPLCTDKKRLSVILSNLLSNAIIYSNARAHEPFIGIHAEVNKKQIIITIHDNGQGIPEEHLKNIFKMFYRASTNSKGSGLGLYIVKETVSKLQGEVSVKSEWGKGSSFTIVLPNMVSQRHQAPPTVLIDTQ